jgi:hypothetical protein
MTPRFAHRAFAPARGLTEERPPVAHDVQTTAPQAGLARLQRVMGNAGIQRMLGRPALPAITQRGQAGQVHRKGCGCAACSGGQREEERPSGASSEVVVQRWWDDEESVESESDGGGWWDSVTEAASDAYDSMTGGGGGGYESESGESESGETGSDEGGSWWDSVTDAASDAYDSVFGGDESAESEGVDADDIADEVSTGEDDWKDFFPDSWFDDEDKTTEEIAEEHESAGTTTTSSGVGSCIASSHGDGDGGEVRYVSVAGLTTANFAASTGASSFKTTSKTKRPKDPPKEGETPEPDVWDVKGKLTMTYTLPKATIAYTYTPDRSEMTACERTAVDAYVKSTLAPHEDQHVAAFATFNGTETIDKAFDGLVGTEAEINTELTSLVSTAAAEAVAARQQMAQDASDILDPFNVEIPGLDKCVEEKKEEEAPEGSSSEE